ncbi:ABC-type glycerol-3-phosphate transport system substrate-binding protein [Anaerobacterium chartisolvens]|uniref:ABC-type glycerol-3-phosphate transport system substrate-binding protein n=1 Tax=Anaerobacterium chartisolvens TaxID=1297424 RepID=A0A369B0F0_9FIRM|nr:extracellular solute-binding protein [Anaerobacterium chartisolvens]RCX14805.1 ABC-type glycerol-3-phosphate transport system substrate-binding protein [Anaerobacterium chartisolvens]
MFKRLICILTASAILSGLCGCSGSVGGGGEKDAFSDWSAQYYEEKEIGKGLGIENAGTSLNINSLNQVITYAYRPGDSFYIFADKTGKKIDQHKYILKGSGSLFTINSKDNLYVLDQVYSPDTKESSSRKISYTLNVYNSKGKQQGSFILGSKTFRQSQPSVTDIAVDSNGMVYLLYPREKIEVINADGRRVNELSATGADFIEVDYDNNLIWGSFDRKTSRSSLEKLDPKTGESIWKKEMEPGDVIRQLKCGLKDKNIYVLGDKGIMAFDSEGGIKSNIFDFRQSSLLEPGVSIKDMAISPSGHIFMLAFQSASGSGTAASPLLYSYTPSEGGKKSSEQKVLTLAVKFSDRVLESAVSRFQREHPDIRLDVKDYKASWTGSGKDEDQRVQKALEDYRSINTAGLMSGAGADIIDISGLPYRKYIDVNSLADINGMIAQDKSFNISDYSPNIFNACKYNGGLYIVPVTFTFNMLSASKSILKNEAVSVDDSSWTWQDFISIAQKITVDKDGDGTPDQYALPKMNGRELFSYIYNMEYYKFVDYDKKTAAFDSGEFAELLDFAHGFSKRGLSSPEIDSSKLWEMGDSGTIAFTAQYIADYYNLIYARAISNGEVELLRYPSFTGTSGSLIFTPGKAFAINNNSQLKAEAWEFIKLLLSEDIQSSSELYENPVNIRAQKAKAKTAIEESESIREMLKSQYGRDIAPLSQQDIDTMDKIISELSVFPYSDPEVDKIISDEIDEFFSGGKTAGETAKLIQSRVTEYLAK